MFDCQAFLEQVYIKAFSPVTKDDKPCIDIDKGIVNPVSGNFFSQKVTQEKFPLITWVQSGAVYDETVDSSRDSTDFDISISVKRPHVVITKLEPEPPLSRLLNAAEYVLAEMVDCDPSVTLNTAEPDENTINEVRYARAFTLTVDGLVAYDGPLDSEESEKLFGKQ